MKLTENEETAMDIYRIIKDARGDIDMEDPEEIAEFATRMLNTCIHLGGLVERLTAVPDDAPTPPLGG